MYNQKPKPKSIFDSNINPFLQVGIVLLACLVFDLVSTGLRASGLVDVEQNFPWQVILSFLLLFAIFNSLLSLGAKDGSQYYFKSMISFVLLAVIGGGLAYLFSGLTMEEAGAIKWMYFVFTFGYLVFVSIVQVMKKIVELAQKQDKRLRGEE